MSALFWFRRDLRADNNAALDAFLARAKELSLAPSFVFVLDRRQASPSQNRYFSPAAFEFMMRCLRELRELLPVRVVRAAAAEDAVLGMVRRQKVRLLGFNRDVTPFAVARDRKVLDNLPAACEALTGFDGLVDPERMPKGYRVFTPFYRRHLAGIALIPGRAAPAPAGTARAEALAVLAGIRSFQDYEETRDLGRTTGLSRYIKFGAVGQGEVAAAAVRALGRGHPLVRELLYRSFYEQEAYHFPEVLGGMVGRENLGPSRRWKKATVGFSAWARGKTGVPLVDAAQRQLLETGYCNNRARMVSASYLVRDLGVDWRAGERFFAQRLVDYDPCSNSGGWRWAVAQRNPMSPWRQARRFDPRAEYIQRWVSELRGVPARDILALHRGTGYPNPPRKK